MVIQQSMANETAGNVAQCSINLFKSLPKTGKPTANEWTVLSCIVKEQNRRFEAVSLGTGSKCIGRSKMCPKGTVINDSHAEIMCRRGFLRYLYSQLEPDSSLFDLDEQSNLFVLKPGVKFHFFSTQVPCGDAAIFPKATKETPTEDSDDYFKPLAKRRKIDDIFRTGAKCLDESEVQDSKEEGSAYHVVGAVRIKPGRGDRTASVSCSDKFAKWCHLGIQGALLMKFLNKPVYLSSFILASSANFNVKAMGRAFYDRLENVQLVQPYARHSMEFYSVSVNFPYMKCNERIRPCPNSIVWYRDVKNFNIMEVGVNGRKLGITKKHIHSERSRLKICKLEIYKTYLNKCKEFCFLMKDSGDLNLNYGTAKQTITSYQENWDILKQEFGVWTKKDAILLSFFAN